MVLHRVTNGTSVLNYSKTKVPHFQALSQYETEQLIHLSVKRSTIGEWKTHTAEMEFGSHISLAAEVYINRIVQFWITS